MVAVLHNNRLTEVEAEAAETLWVSASDAEQATGWTMKPEGCCSTKRSRFGCAPNWTFWSAALQGERIALC